MGGVVRTGEVEVVKGGRSSSSRSTTSSSSRGSRISSNFMSSESSLRKVSAFLQNLRDLLLEFLTQLWFARLLKMKQKTIGRSGPGT